mmetsp:Transcript_64250/g.198909  ORF Transcript_64250/g.198909 Transcript_64250/m.198909 type:complete len:419 (-) Transcript_64250:612-1868(-)
MASRSLKTSTISLSRLLRSRCSSNSCASWRLTVFSSHSKKRWALRGDSSLWTWTLWERFRSCASSSSTALPPRPSMARFTTMNLCGRAPCVCWGNLAESLMRSWPMVLTTDSDTVSSWFPAPVWVVNWTTMTSPGFTSRRKFVSMPCASSPVNTSMPLALTNFSLPIDFTAGTVPLKLASSSKASCASVENAPRWCRCTLGRSLGSPFFRVMSAFMSIISVSICKCRPCNMVATSPQSCRTVRMAVMAAKTWIFVASSFTTMAHSAKAFTLMKPERKWSTFSKMCFTRSGESLARLKMRAKRMAKRGPVPSFIASAPSIPGIPPPVAKGLNRLGRRLMPTAFSTNSCGMTSVPNWSKNRWRRCVISWMKAFSSACCLSTYRDCIKLMAASLMTPMSIFISPRPTNTTMKKMLKTFAGE